MTKEDYIKALDASCRQEGSRSADIGLIAGVITGELWQALDDVVWEVQELKTSRPDWAVPVWWRADPLPNDQGRTDAPTCLRDQEWAEAFARIQAWLAVGYRPPAVIDPSDPLEVLAHTPRFNKYHFRRAAALGLKI